MSGQVAAAGDVMKPAFGLISLCEKMMKSVNSDEGANFDEKESLAELTNMTEQYQNSMLKWVDDLASDEENPMQSSLKKLSSHLRNVDYSDPTSMQATLNTAKDIMHEVQETIEDSEQE